MDYKKAYEEALERAKSYLEEENYTEMADVFPELAESYDDIIREELVEAFAVYGNDSFWNGIPIKSILAWLKKQKPVDTTEIAHCINCPVYEKAEWSEEDEKMLNELITIMDGGKVTSGTYLSEYVAWLKSLRPQPKQEWTEEDEKMLNKFINRLETVSLYTRTDSTSLNFSFFNEIGWLKSLRKKLMEE